MMRRKQQARPFTLEPFLDALLFLPAQLPALRVRWSSPNTSSVSQSARMRSSMGCLYPAWSMRWNTATGCPVDFTGDLPESAVRSDGIIPAYRQCPEEIAATPFRRFVDSARARCALRSWWKIDSPFRWDRVAIPTGSSRPVDAESSFAGCVFTRYVVLVVGARGLFCFAHLKDTFPGKPNCDSRLLHLIKHVG